MGALSVKRASEEDLEPLLEMMEDFNLHEHIPWTREAGTPALRALIASRELGFVGLLHEGEALAGYFILTFGFDLEWSGRDAFLTELYLAEGARGRGLSRIALAEIDAVARAHEVRALHLVVRPENAAAVRAYEGAGYRAIPRVLYTKVLPEGEDAS